MPEQYVHRIGRTARAGAEGVAISFVADDERPYLKAIERATRVKLDVVPLPENFLEAVRNLPKPAPQRKGPSQSPAQQAKRAAAERSARKLIQSLIHRTIARTLQVIFLC